MANTQFSATAKVHITIEVDLRQCWGDDNVGSISKRTREEAEAYIRNLGEKEKKLRIISVDDCFISLHSKK